MNISTITLLLVFAVLITAIRKSHQELASKRMILLFAGYWGVVLTLSTLGLYGMNKPSAYALFLLVTNVIMFTLGFSVIKTRDVAISYTFNDTKSLFEVIINSKIFTVLLIVSTSVSVVAFQTFQSFVETGWSYSEMRTGYFEGDIYGSISVFFSILLTPMENICIPIFGYMLIYKKNWLFFLVAFFLLLYASLGAGRFGYVRIAVGILFISYCMVDRIKLSIKKLFLPFLGLVCLVLAISVVTALRSGNNSIDGESTLKTFTSYAVGSIPAFNYAVENDYVEKIGGYKYGRLTLSSIEGLSYSLLGRFGIQTEKAIDMLIPIKQTNIIDIGNGSWNALYTAVLYFYLDGGMLGCIIFPFLLGMAFRFTIKLLYRYKSWPLIILVSMFFQMVLHSVSDYSFYNPFTFIFVVLLFYLGLRKSDRKIVRY